MRFALALIVLFAVTFSAWQVFTPLQRREAKRTARRFGLPILTFSLVVFAALYAAAHIAGIKFL